MSKKLVIFDMDGTLIDSSNLIANAINHVRAKLSLPPMPKNIIVEKVNDNTINPAKFFYHLESFLPEHTEWFNQYYTRNHKSDLILYDGILDILQMLKDDGIKIALATNAYRVSALESIESLNIVEYFNTVVAVDDVKNGKPNPDMIHAILKDLDYSVDDAVFVGDGPRDSQAARNAGMDYLMVDWGFTTFEENEDVIVNTRLLKDILLKLTTKNGDI